MNEYRERLLHALKLAKKEMHQLQKHLGVTYTALKALQDGRSKSLSAKNNVLAARYLDVDPLWLATGDGKPEDIKPWPFELIRPTQYEKLDPNFKRIIENQVIGEWMRSQKQTA
jgi:hypothetical protein